MKPITINDQKKADAPFDAPACRPAARFSSHKSDNVIAAALIEAEPELGAHYNANDLEASAKEYVSRLLSAGRLAKLEREC